MLDKGILDRFFFELEQKLILPAKIFENQKAITEKSRADVKILRRRKNPETLAEKLKHIKKRQITEQSCSEGQKDLKKHDPEKNDRFKKAKKEISDAVSELADDIDTDKKSENFKNFSDEKRSVYFFVGFEHKVMDYSKLEYGKIAEPLAVVAEYEVYHSSPKNKNEFEFGSEQTISERSVEKIISERFLFKHSTTTNVTPDERIGYQFYKLFNSALVKVKKYVASV
jgi:hypothetical protein